MRAFRTSLIFLAITCGASLAQQIHPNKIYPEFAVGPTGIYATIEKERVVTVQKILPDTPASKTNLQAGDVLLAAGGKSLAVDDPRVPLGLAIGAAEAADGRLVFAASRGGKQGKVTVALPVLGGYGETWPENCAKSAAVIKATAARVAAAQQPDGSYRFGTSRPERDGLTGCLAGLFLLSTGDANYLPNVRRHARALASKVATRPTKSNWHLGYQGILLAEYYLKTGDKSVLPGLKSLCDQAISAQAAGGWGHGGIPGPGYVQSGLMSSAGVPVLTTLVLASECGVEFDRKGYAKAVKFMYRMAGHGCVPYGDHRSELWWSNTNGRNGKLVCAFSLLDDPRLRAATQHLATMVADSYFQPEFGHTGGGFNVIWRGMASAHVPEHRRGHYSRQMEKLRWYYDLCRLPGGGFHMLPTPPDNARYAGPVWGTGAIGLTYTAPLRTLRITGAKPTKFSVTTKPPEFDWGTAADVTFLSTRDADGFGKESAEPHEIYRKTIGKEKGTAAVEFYAKHLRHYSPLVRTWSARALREKNSPAAQSAIADALKHRDPRVRRAAFDAISGYDNWGRPFKATIPTEVVSERYLPSILQTLRDPDSAWWEIDGALFALGRAAPDDIRKHMDIIEKFARHQEWYLREGAFWALVGLHRSMTGTEFQKLTDMYARSRHVFERSSYDAGFRMILKTDKVVFDRIAERAVARALGKATHDVPLVPEYGVAALHEAAHRTMMVTKHFDSRIYADMIPDFEKYLQIWEPYYQHSVWLITGSRWQPGILKVLEGLGKEGKPIAVELENILGRYGRFDPKRIGKAGREMEQQIRAAVDSWKKKFDK